MPQGSILGPILFILYFNDVVYTTEDVSIINYADDTVIYTASEEIKEINAKLSKTLAELSTWFSKNELILNLQKGKLKSCYLELHREYGNARNHYPYGMRIV